MLAPRKKLWSTPTPAITAITNLAPLTSNDTLYDVGCGDGRVLLHLASTTSCRHFVGIEIDVARAAEARNNVERARREDVIPDGTEIEIRCRNALEEDYGEATVVFLYLVPRGLRLIKPLLLRGLEGKRDQEQGSGVDDCGVDNGGGKKINGNDDHSGSTSTTNGHDVECCLRQRRKSLLRVVTYMAPFEDETHVRKELCNVEHQEGSAWPIFLYHFGVGDRCAR